MPITQIKVPIKDMPKLESPFEREHINGNYVLVPKLKDEFRWIFTEECMAVEKIDGTCTSIYVEGGNIVSIFNRTNRIDMWSQGGIRFVEGIQQAIVRNYINLKRYKNNQIFGELIGPKVQGNPYRLDRHFWMPFIYMKRKYNYRFWGDVCKECEGRTDEEKFEIVSNTFKELWSLVKRRFWGEWPENKNMREWVNENIGFKECAAEGIVFYKRHEYDSEEYGNCCKLRRDMFEWFKGPEHKKKNV